MQALLKITGRVQGVFYRAGCKEKAEQLSLTGHARNLPDGSVEVLVQGEKSAIKTFIVWAKEGTERAKVKTVDIVHMRPAHSKNPEDFRIF